LVQTLLVQILLVQILLVQYNYNITHLN